MNPIKHIWFDFSDTIASPDEGARNALRYETYGKVQGKAVTSELIEDYLQKYRENGESNAGVFASFGLPSSFWSDTVNASNPSYRLIDSGIPNVLERLQEVRPISIFSNLDLTKILPGLGISGEWFAHILAAGMVKKPKPDLEGFYKIAELSELPPADILYVGDNVYKDLRPAKATGLQTGLVWSESPEADYSFKNFEDILTLAPKA